MPAVNDWNLELKKQTKQPPTKGKKRNIQVQL